MVLVAQGDAGGRNGTLGRRGMFLLPQIACKNSPEPRPQQFISISCTTNTNIFNLSKCDFDIGEKERKKKNALPPTISILLSKYKKLKFQLKHGQILNHLFSTCVFYLPFHIKFYWIQFIFIFSATLHMHINRLPQAWSSLNGVEDEAPPFRGQTA